MVYYLDCGKHRSYRQVLIELESNLTTTRQYCVHFVPPPLSISCTLVSLSFATVFFLLVYTKSFSRILFFFPLKVIKRLFCRKVLTLMKKTNRNKIGNYQFRQKVNTLKKSQYTRLWYQTDVGKIIIRFFSSGISDLFRKIVRVSKGC